MTHVRTALWALFLSTLVGCTVPGGPSYTYGKRPADFGPPIVPSLTYYDQLKGFFSDPYDVYWFPGRGAFSGLPPIENAVRQE